MKDYNPIADDVISSIEAPFNYTGLNVEMRLVVQQCTNEIKERMRRAAEDIKEIGRSLVEVRECLEYGSFDVWLRAEFGWSRRAAYNFINVYERFSCANFAQVDIAPSALYLLAARSTLDAVRREALERAYQGESITHAKVKTLVAGRHVKRNGKRPKVVDTFPNESSESVLRRLAVEQEFFLGDEQTLPPATHSEVSQITEGAIASITPESPYKSGDIAFIKCPASAGSEYLRWNGCWGLVKSVGQLGSVEVVVAGLTMRFPPSDLEIIDNPSPVFVEVAEKVVRLLKRDDLDACERYLLMGFYLRQQTFTERQMEMLVDIMNHYEDPESV